MLRRNADGSITPMTMPNHPQIKGSTLPTILRQAKIDLRPVHGALEAAQYAGDDVWHADEVGTSSVRIQ